MNKQFIILLVHGIAERTSSSMKQNVTYADNPSRFQRNAYCNILHGRSEYHAYKYLERDYLTVFGFLN